MKSTFFPHFTIGVDAYDAIPDICLDYGKTASLWAARSRERQRSR